MTACRELVLVTEADGSESSAHLPDAKPSVPPDQANIDALSRKLSRMLGRGKAHAICMKKSLRQLQQLS